MYNLDCDLATAEYVRVQSKTLCKIYDYSQLILWPFK